MSLVAAMGGLFTASPSNWLWYDSLVQPAFTPPNWIFPIVWNLIYLMVAISIIIVWNKGNQEKRFLWFIKWKKTHPLFRWTISLFMINGVLNALWSLLFFSLNQIDLAFIDILLLEATNIALVFLTWKISKPASVLLWLYTAWVAFASFLNFQYLILN